jgi:hypothetical protein
MIGHLQEKSASWPSTSSPQLLHGRMVANEKTFQKNNLDNGTNPKVEVARETEEASRRYR